jgi:hypothetical protein
MGKLLMSRLTDRFAGLAIAAISLLAWSGTAQAVPSFALQTGQPCAMCHVGSFGPQLTPFGRAFKIGGYTQTGGDGWQSQVPVSVMAIGSFNNTAAAMPADQVAQHYGANNNLSLDQTNVFLAGRITDWAGGFMQITYSPVDNTGNLDNTDLRPFTKDIDALGGDLRVGISVNDNPTVQDPYNSTPAWGYPYVLSSLAPTPAAAPLLDGAMALNSIGVTAYAWYNSALYLEAGGYSTMSPWLMARIGEAYGPGQTSGLAPYLRAAYEWDWNNQAAHIGALFMQAGFDPATGSFTADGSNGHDGFTDYALDGSYAWLGDGTNIFTLQGNYIYEQQNLQGSTNAYNNANATTLGPHSSLNQTRVTASYWYKNTYGANISWMRLWGPSNPVLYQTGTDVYGSANGKPNSNAFTLEADWVPFGKADSWMQPWINLKLGVQYTAYTEFNGATNNYDGFGRNASDNNTLFMFAWLAF